ncbi:MAG: tyrosine-type recombinase/integrase [Legionellaceae bacterium]|nr:tyrosine-type recombinase/integrase [Legionellaceae bacterium]
MPILYEIQPENIINGLDNPSWYDNEKWKFSDLGIDGNQADNFVTFSFKSIRQDWLKRTIKNFILRVYIGKSCHTVSQLISSINSFSEFLHTLPPSEQAKNLDGMTRMIVINYIGFLGKQSISQTTRQIRSLTLSNFFEICRELGWVYFKSNLIYQEDIPKRPNKVPRFIPESVLNQLNDNIQHIDPHVRRLILLLQETGVRISEAIKLPFDCIFQDKDGDFFLKYHLSKINKEHVIPISHQLASIIQEQQKAVSNEWEHHNLLFTMPHYIQYHDQNVRTRKAVNRGSKWSRRHLARYFDKFASDYQILGPDGQLWKFQFHSFRHTVATQMINNKVPQHIIQRYLGHESPTMTSRYAHIFDETLKTAFSEFRGKMVDITGTIVTPEQVTHDLAQGSNPDDINVRWLKKNIMAQALPNGTCALPVISNSCPHANACLSCVNFRTDHRYLDTHKAQLEKTKAIVSQAKHNGWKRQLEMNLTLQTNLEKIVNTLEIAL